MAFGCVGGREASLGQWSFNLSVWLVRSREKEIDHALKRGEIERENRETEKI